MRASRMSRVHKNLLAGTVAALALFGGCTPPTAPGRIERVSVASDGTEADGFASSSSISADGRYIAFDSSASNLVPDDTNDTRDVFLHDRETSTTTRISVASDGTQANNYSANPSISADGRYIAFASDASNLVPNDTNDTRDVFLHDRETNTTTRISVASDGTQANGGSWESVISADGRYIAFMSGASNLVLGDANDALDVFLHDRETSTTTRISVASDGTQANGPPTGSYSPYTLDGTTISADGRYIAFTSVASNLVPNDTNDAPDIFLHDRETSTTTRISVASDGTQTHDRAESFYPSISADGRYIAYTSTAMNLVPGPQRPWNAFRSDAFLYDRSTGTTSRVSVAWDGVSLPNDGSYARAISADGRYVLLTSRATNLVCCDFSGVLTPLPDIIYVFDRDTGVNMPVESALNGASPDGISYTGAITPDGRHIVFTSDASNLVPGDTNGHTDVFVWDRLG